MTSFLLIQTRPEDAASDAEYESFRQLAGLQPQQLHRIRAEAQPMPEFSLDDYDGIILGGSPFNSSDPLCDKSVVQQRVEAELAELMTAVIAQDYPFLGACYGVGVVGTHQHAVVDRTFGEPVGAKTIHLTAEGKLDPLFFDLPDPFEAFCGHKEAITELPEHAVNLAYSEYCPVQAFRVGSNVYATQFHPELNAESLCARMDVYENYGYFDPRDAAEMKKQAHQANVVFPHRVLTRFVELYRS